MDNDREKQWAGVPNFLACAALMALWSGSTFAQSEFTSGPSFGQSVSESFHKMGEAVTPTPAPKQTDDPISLKTESKPSVDLYVAVARLYEESNNLPAAEEEFKKALKLSATDLRVLLGYAKLKDRMNQPQEAIKFYQQAERKHPKEPTVFNNLAIHFAQRDMFREAIAAEQRAVELLPTEPRYHNNLATLFVEVGRTKEAYEQFRAVPYDEPTAHYNLAFVLNKKGLKAAAIQEFTIALQMNPGMAPARQWVERLSVERGDGRGIVQIPRNRPVATALSQLEDDPIRQAAPVYPEPRYQTPPANPGVAARDPRSVGVRVLSPPTSQGAEVQRLPPAGYPAQSTDLIAPNPPGYR